MTRIIKFFDTTLRDGEQTPGISLNIREKLDIAKQLVALGIDIIEAGFPNASQGDFDAVSAIAKEVKGAQICGFCRATASDIQRGWEAVRMAEEPRLNIFIATSELHMQYKLRMTEEEVIERAVAAISLGRSLCPNIEFSAEDASRSEPEFLYRVIQKVIAAGATVINVPDTVGYGVPNEFGDLIRGIFQNVPNIDKAEIAVHCHNDLGLAVANTLAAVEAGATQVECTINGLGERAGNASLEELVMTINTRPDYYNIAHHIKTNQIFRTSRLVSSYTGIDVQPNKAIVGDNAFRHAAGIHQHGVMLDRRTYEIMTPETIGLYMVDDIVLGKLSGSHAFEDKAKELGYHLSKEDLKEAFTKFKRLADRKKQVTNKDIIAIVEGSLSETPGDIELVDYQIISSNKTSSTANIIINREGEQMQEAAIGPGPIDAAYNAIDRLTGLIVSLQSYSLKAVTEGKDALGEVTVRVKHGDKVYLGRGVSPDIIESSIFAYINAINRVLADIPVEKITKTNVN
ncbi:MAG: 2-isopropylmalate synthase [Bacillota bacterium]|jgi:2-isopropylmalate synthase